MIEREPVSPWPPSPSIADFTVPIRIRWWPPDGHYLPRVKLKHRYITYRKSRQFNLFYRSKLRGRRKHPNQQIKYNHQLNKRHRHCKYKKMSSPLALAACRFQCKTPSKQSSVFFDNEKDKNTSNKFASVDVPPSSSLKEEKVVVIDMMGGGKELLIPPYPLLSVFVIITAATTSCFPSDHG